MSETRTDPVDDLGHGGDEELIARVRAGDGSAYGTLFARHVGAARRLAVQLAGRSEADDLVSEAFMKVLLVLRRGAGPDVAFRAYLLTAVRRLHVDRVRSLQQAQPTDDLTPYDEGVPFTDPAVAGFEGDAATKAFASLPERWQMVLWHVEVEGQKPAEVAPLLGIRANAVSALAHRAREGLREAYLNMHTTDELPDDPECRWVHEHLGGYVRDGLSERDSERVRAHLDVCLLCGRSHLELASFNSEIRELIGPFVLGGAAAAYLAGGPTAGGAGVAALLGRTRDLIALNAKTAAVAAVGSTIAVATITTALVTHDARPDRPAADHSAGTTSTARAEQTVSRATPTRARHTASAGATASATASPSPVQASDTGSASPSATPSATRAARTAGASASTSPTTAAANTADVRVIAGRQSTTGTATNGLWTVSGVPSGLTTALTITVPSGAVLSSTDCTGAGTRLSCKVGSGSGTFRVVNASGHPKQVLVRVATPPGYDDPRLANNAATLTAS